MSEPTIYSSDEDEECDTITSTTSSEDMTVTWLDEHGERLFEIFSDELDKAKIVPWLVECDDIFVNDLEDAVSVIVTEATTGVEYSGGDPIGKKIHNALSNALWLSDHENKQLSAVETKVIVNKSIEMIQGKIEDYVNENFF